MRGQAKWGRARWLGGLAGLAAAIIAWQGVQAWSMGALGVPGVLILPISDQESYSADDEDAFSGGVTVVAKTRRGAARQAAPAQRLVAARQPMVVAEVEADQQPTGSIPALEATPAPSVAAQPVLAAAEPRQEAAAPRAPLRSGMAASGAVSEPRLPWLASSPSRTDRVAAALPPQPSPEPAELPSESDVRGWVRAEAEEFLGGVDAEGIPLYRFHVWLEAPPEAHQRIVSVAYNFDAPSAKPKAQESREQGNGFRVKFGGASCARTVLVTVTLDDGRSQAAEVDGCAILN